MTDPKQPLYDILREAFDAGIWHASGESGKGPSAATVILPLAARMEEVVNGLINETQQAALRVAQSRLVKRPTTSPGKTWNTAIEHVISDLKSLPRSLPSSPERET